MEELGYVSRIYVGLGELVRVESSCVPENKRCVSAGVTKKNSGQQANEQTTK